MFCVIRGSWVVVCAAPGTVGLWFITAVWVFSVTVMHKLILSMSQFFPPALAESELHPGEDCVVGPLLANSCLKGKQSSALLC